MASASVTDVLIIGGSHAGLSAALTLYRALHTSVIFDTHKPRNWYSSPVRLTPTWDNQDPEKLREASREELRGSKLCHFVDAAVQRVKKLDNGLFQAIDAHSELWLGRKLLLAIGVEDDFPNLPGYKENYPARIFPCMFQFGYEQRSAHSAGLLAIDSLANPLHAPKLADDAHKFTNVITIYTNANAALATELSQTLQYPGILVDDREIACLVAPASSSSSPPSSSSEITIEFANGEIMTESFLVHRPLTKLDHTLSDQLGLDYGMVGEIKTSPPFCQTSVDGVFAAGDCASMMKIIPNAISMGAYAGAGIARELPKRVTGAMSRWGLDYSAVHQSPVL